MLVLMRRKNNKYNFKHAKIKEMEELFSKFDQDGVVVFENLLTKDEVTFVRDQFHQTLENMGIPLLQKPEKIGIRKKSEISTIYYPDWKIFNVHLNTRVLKCIQGLLEHTYLSDENKIFPSLFPVNSNIIYPFVDRVCYRLPDEIQAEGGLGLHIDNHPELDVKLLKKWRPIQAFVTLTDHFDAESGGLKVVRGFHKEFSTFFKNNQDLPKVKGEFFRMNSPSFSRLQKRSEFVYAPKGSLVCWDYRLPHSTCEKLKGNDTREVVYTGFLPDCEINRNYAKRQWEHIVKNMSPPAFDLTENAGRNWELNRADNFNFGQRIK